ncbi:hypothetical protein BH23GEM6_BH23GEM6_00280 [soil metagenome]
MLFRLIRAQDETDRRLFAWELFMILEPLEVEFHLPLICGLEASQLEVDGDEPPQSPVEEETASLVPRPRPPLALGVSCLILFIRHGALLAKMESAPGSIPYL